MFKTVLYYKHPISGLIESRTNRGRSRPQAPHSLPFMLFIQAPSNATGIFLSLVLKCPCVPMVVLHANVVRSFLPPATRRTLSVAELIDISRNKSCEGEKSLSIFHTTKSTEQFSIFHAQKHRTTSIFHHKSTEPCF
jgi:hypothetical protein